jgi:hypothetical protein
MTIEQWRGGRAVHREGDPSGKSNLESEASSMSRRGFLELAAGMAGLTLLGAAGCGAGADAGLQPNGVRHKEQASRQPDGGQERCEDREQDRDHVVIGAKESVELSTEGHQQPVEVLAKVDTGASSSSIDYDLADELDIDLDDAETVTVESALGEEERPLVKVRMRVAGKTLETEVMVSDRDEFEEKMLLGRRDLDGFLVDVSAERLTSPESPTFQ